MAYNTLKDNENKSRKRKRLRLEKRTKLEERQERIRNILLKNKQEGLRFTNLEGYTLDESSEVKKIW